MAYYWGYQTVDITSYDTFRQAVNGNGFNCNEDEFGAQCLDLFMLLNYNVGGYSAPPYCKADPDGYAYQAWATPSSRAYNASDKYELIYDITQLKRGDMVVMNYTTSNPAGHNSFCDADYDPNRGYIPMLGQNQGGAPFPDGGACANIANWSLDNFLGAFRLKQWQPVVSRPRRVQKRNFPWVLYARKLRGL